MSRDVLSELASGTMTVDEVYTLCDTLLESSAPTVEADLGLSHLEWTAFCHGVGFDELSRWRQDGWPSRCPVCGKPITVEAFGWLAQEIPDGTHHLVHISCL
jgi:hypothetical protein